jgi:hypothetical protein
MYINKHNIISFESILYTILNHGYKHTLELYKTNYFLKYNYFNFSCHLRKNNSYVNFLIFKFYYNIIQEKKIIKWYANCKIKKTIKFKTKNNYIKGYNKN